MSDEAQISRIEGPNLCLRLVRPGDADYLYGLRTNADLNRHLSPITGGAEGQRLWILDYMAREAASQEFYYVIERRDGVPCGTVRLYNIKPDTFTWGSWILDQNKPRKAALESAVLSFSVGFGLLNRQKAFVDVRIANERALSFYLRLGMIETHRTAQDIHLTYRRAKFEADRDALLSIVQTQGLA